MELLLYPNILPCGQLAGTEWSVRVRLVEELLYSSSAFSDVHTHVIQLPYFYSCTGM